MKGVEQDFERAVRLYERAVVENADVDPMYNLELMLSDGVGGVAQDFERTVRLYERAIDESAHVRSM